MILIIDNLLEVQRSYLSGAAIVPANGSLTVPITQIFPIARDPQLIADCDAFNVELSDSVTTYRGFDALNYLNTIALSLGGQVVGYIGANIPSFAIVVAGENENGEVRPILLGASGLLPVNGNIASEETDSGNPIKTGAVYNDNLPAAATGDRVDSQANMFGETAFQFRNKFSNLTGNATTTVKSGKGRLHGILINDSSTGGTVTIYDNTAASGTKIGTLGIGTATAALGVGVPNPIFLGPLGLEFSTGLTVVTAGSSANNITILYQ